MEFKSKLRNIDWENKFISGSAQDDFTIFFNEVKYLFDQTFPKEKVEIKYSNKNPWISNKIKKDIIQREKLHFISKTFPTELNIQKYKSFKNQNLSDQKAAERSYYKDQFGILGDDLRKSFKVLRKVIGKQYGQNMANIDFIIRNKLVSDETEIANGFNNYFVTVGKSLTKNTNNDVNPLDYIQSNSKSIVIPDITVGDIINVISSLNNSSAGYDDMPASIMKKCIDEYITLPTYLINYSIRQGVFPDELKIAKIIPIFKSGNEQCTNNYRPISVLPFFSKIYEKVMANSFTNFLDANDLLYNSQFGFRHNHSTSHAIITLIEKISRALDTGKIVCNTDKNKNKNKNILILILISINN